MHTRLQKDNKAVSSNIWDNVHKDISSNKELSLVNSGPFQVICKYPSDENIDNKDFDSIEAEIKDKHFGDQVTFYTIRPGHNNIENNNLVIGEFSAPKWINRNHIIELVKETVSKYVTVLEIISISRFDDR